MPKPGHRSRSLRRVKIVTPGGVNKTVYKKRKPQKAHCAECGAVLSGVPRERPYKMQNMPKTAKRPERPYGGVLCSRCTRKAMIAKAREISGNGSVGDGVALGSVDVGSVGAGSAEKPLEKPSAKPAAKPLAKPVTKTAGKMPGSAKNAVNAGVNKTNAGAKGAKDKKKPGK
ncbi:50S ribosomal protein L34e [Candidatus Woesearchaeota archaeon]|nr:50S ribosomal protein L34e [Candidatus Woesearchaeota archaeon]